MSSNVPKVPLPESLAGQSVLVIGGTSGIGAAAARLLEHVGADVTVGSRSVDAGEAGGAGSPRRVQLDVTDEAQLTAAVAGLPAIDHVYLTAGGFVPGSIAEMESSLARELLLSRAEDALRVARVVAPRMPPGGSLTFTSANSAMRPGPGGSGSGAAAAALEGVALALAVELAPLRVNTIRVGLADTEGIRRAFRTDEALAELGRTLPLKRVARAEEVAAAALFLMANPYVTASIVTVDGGAWLV
jgi:NAD(P)-dependent dehydrogenase (short-subunit alcohol dehydrogenase family)